MSRITWRFGVGPAAAALCALLLASACRPPAPSEPPAGPRLVLWIVVDQFQAAYLERFAPLWRGGLRRLLDQGAVFTDTHHRHAETLTAPGHASLATGCHPRRHGIIRNYWFDPVTGRRIYSVGDPEHGVSPARLLEPTLGDWLKLRSERSRVYAVSGKDRSAVLMAGRRADAAFWYSGGRFRSNHYYPNGAPAWLEAFHADDPAEQWFGTAWRPLPLPADVLEAAGVEAFDFGPLKPDFPHVLGGLSLAPNEGYFKGLAASPFQDEYLTRFAERLIVEEELGGDGWTDLLVLAYSALDAVGHSYGAESPEVLDLLLRLDRTLEELLQLVDRRVGLDEVVVAFSSDHGVAPLPELGGGRRLGAEDVLCYQGVNGRLAERFGEERWLLPGPFVNPGALSARGVEHAAIEEEAARLLAECPRVARVWRRAELAAAGEPEAELFHNSFHPERSPDLLVQFEPLFTPTLSAATHGSSWPYDTRVPLILLAPGLGPLRDEGPAATVDVAPTLATLVGLTPPAVDGTDLGPRLRPSAPAAP